MSDEHRVNEDRQNPARKRGYVPPKLVCYGRVRDLTQAGTAGANEYLKIGSICIPLTNDPNRKSCGSDQHIKENIVRIGNHSLGIGLYLFDYKPEFRDEWGHGRQFGVIAQEIETVMSEAVSIHPNGYRMVDYAMLGVTRSLD